MGKTKRGEKEYSREQRYVKENQRLKREISSLRKKLARIDLDRFSSAKDLIEESFQGDSAPEGDRIIEKLKKEWACKEPNCTGFLEIFTYYKMDSLWYFRKCSISECKNRTKAQIYSPEVKGLRKEKINDT